MEAERLPRGADPARHLKLGRGGLSDVEWLAQLLQLQHAGQHPELRTTSTVEALEGLPPSDSSNAGDVVILLRAWRLASRIRSANVIWTGRASDVLPSSRRDLEAVARWCGYGQGNAAALEEDYLRLSRRARACSNGSSTASSALRPARPAGGHVRGLTLPRRGATLGRWPGNCL